MMCANRAVCNLSRLLAFFMVLLLLFTVVVVPIRASAVLGTVAVVGTVVMTLAALADIFMIACGAAGMDGAIRNQASATGTQPMDYMGQLMNRWSNNTGRKLGVVANLFQAGFHYLSDGTFQLDSACTEVVADFQQWAWSADGGNLAEFANTGVGNEYQGSGYTAIRFSPTEEVQAYSYNYYVDMDMPFDTNFEAGGADAHYVCFSTPVPVAYFSLTYSRYQSYQVWVYVPTAALAGTTFYAAGTGTWSNSNPKKSVQSGTWTMLSNYGAQGGSADYPIGPNPSVTPIPDVADMVASSGVVGDPDTFVGPMLQGEGSEIPASFTVSPEAASQLHLSNYLRARAAAYAGTGTVDVPLTDVNTGEEETLPLSVPLDTPLTVTGISDASLEQSGSIAGSDAVASDFEGLDDYTMDLTSFFPFCIPFDFAALLSKFEAEAAAPVVDLPFPNPMDEENPVSVHIDLSAYDSLAAVVRKLELIAFCVGLCLLTKHLIQGGD